MNSTFEPDKYRAGPKAESIFMTERLIMKLQPFLELGKQITGSPLCEIDIIDWNYQWIVTDHESDYRAEAQNTTVFYDTLLKSGSLEIEDLSKDNRYRELYYVEGKPHLRYYFGVKLTSSDGKDIGTLSVLDSFSKRITKQQKVQFKLLAHAVMMAIESESSQHTISGELDMLKKNLQRLDHDVRSPVNGITGLADLMMEMEGREKLHVSIREILMMKEAAQSIIDIVSGALADGIPEKKSKKEELPERRLLSDVLVKVEKLFNPLAKKKGVTLSLANLVNKKEHVPYSFSVKLIRIVGNLVSNAIKFSPENETVEIILKDDSERNPLILDITVKNAGKSMTSEQIQSFTSGDAVARMHGTREEKGFGLGLQHVHQMVSEEGGSATAERGEHSGTIFSIVIPVPKDDTVTAEKPEPYVNIGYAKPTVNGKD